MRSWLLWSWWRRGWGKALPSVGRWSRPPRCPGSRLKLWLCGCGCRNISGDSSCSVVCIHSVETSPYTDIFFPDCSFGCLQERISASLRTPPTSTWNWAAKLLCWRARHTHSPAWRWGLQGLDLLWWVHNSQPIKEALLKLKFAFGQIETYFILKYYICFIQVDLFLYSL